MVWHPTAGALFPVIAVYPAVRSYRCTTWKVSDINSAVQIASISTICHTGGASARYVELCIPVTSSWLWVRV